MNSRPLSILNFQKYLIFQSIKLPTNVVFVTLCLSVFSLNLSATCETVADHFNTQSYFNQNGTANWSSGWTELGDNGSASSGEVLITSSGTFQFDNDFNTGVSATRQANLSGADHATLTFAYHANGSGLSAFDVFAIQVSTNGSTFTTLQSFDGAFASTANYAEIDLTNHISSTTYIRIRVTSGYTGTDWFDIDNLTITYCTLDCEESGPKIGGNLVDASTSGSTDGEIDLTIYDGESPFIFSWNTGASSEDLTGLSVGDYYVTVTDNNSCTAVDTLTIHAYSGVCGGSEYFTEGMAVVTCATLTSSPSNQQYTVGAFDITQATYDNNLSVVTDKHHASWVFDTIGNVFGITFDNFGNAYVTASSSYSDEVNFTSNSHIYEVGYGQLGGGINDLNAAGTIYKLDACTGKASVFAQLPQQNTTLDYGPLESGKYGSFSTRTTGPGLGNITFNPNGGGLFYVTNFEDGKIYRLNESGTTLNTYDPFTADNGATGFAPLGERLWAVEYNPNDNRLYYSVWNDYGGTYDLNPSSKTMSTIYSVELDSLGNFLTATNQLEHDGSGFRNTVTPWRSDLDHYDLSAPISDISFSHSGIMAITQRNMGNDVVGWNHLSAVLILEKNNNAWVLTHKLISGQNEYDSYGGVDWAHDENSLWVSSADLLNEDGPHGIQGVQIPDMPFHGRSLLSEFIAYDPGWTGSSGQDFKGVGGELEIFGGTYYRPPISTPTSLCSGGDLQLECGAGSCPSPYPDVGTYSSLFGRDNNYAVFVGGDLNVTGGVELEGKGFVYGDFNFNPPSSSTNYNTGYVGVGTFVVPDADTDWLTIGGDLNFNGLYLIAGGASTIAGNGNVRVKGAADPNDFFPGNGTLIQDPSLDLTDFDVCFTEINTLSQCWNGETSSSNGSYSNSFGTYTFSSSNGASGLYVFNVTTDMNPGFAGTINFSNFPNDATILINVDKSGSNDNIILNIGSFGGISDELRQRIIWNFADAQTVTLMGGSNFIGSIVLPSPTSTLIINTAGTNGRIIAGGNVNQQATSSEFHNYSFEGDLTPISCSSPSCSITVSATPSTCNSATNNYSVSGNLTFSNAPSTGTLTVSIGANSQTFSAPFSSPQAYSLTGLTADGASHTVTASFSAEPCSNTTSYTAPASCSGGGGSTCTYRDEFDAVSYSNSDGTEVWSTNWIEVNDGSNGPNGNAACHVTDYVIYVAESGDCTFYVCPNSNNCLTINAIGAGVGDYIYREFDLTGATSATLSFDFNEALSGSDEVELDVNSGGSWVNLRTYNSASGSGSESIDLSSYISANTQIRFIETAANSGGEIGFDNIEISFDCTTCTVSASTISGDQTICSGGDPNAFTVTSAATGSGTLSYQWQSSTTDCSTGFSNIGGATSDTYDAPSGLTQTTFYRVIVSNTDGMETCQATSNCLTVTVNPTSSGSETYTGCSGDGYSVTVNGTIYNESNPTGSETLMNYLGCDSTVTVNLTFNPTSSNSETYTGCTGDGYSVTVNGTIYNESNPTGSETLMNYLGCDSTVTINLTFNPTSSNSETYTGCTGDGYSVTVNSTIYNESNPTGSETLMNYLGCDSTVTVNLTFNSLPVCSITGANSVTQNTQNETFSAPNSMTTYNWNITSGDAVIDGAANAQTVTIDFGTTTSVIQLTITDANGCSSVCTQTVTISAFDWGDLPDISASTAANDYQTNFANNGPRHSIISGLNLGSTIDAESDGQSSNLADGDGLDEDGFTFPNTLNITPNSTFQRPLNITNSTGMTAYLEGWIDWNGDGDFEDSDEMIVDLSDDGAGDFGMTNITINVPSTAVQNQLIGVRFRLSHTNNMTPYGQINSGEVEDYLISVGCPSSQCLPVQFVIIRK